MSLNVSVVTETGQSVLELDVAGYLAGIAAHVGGDWSQHACLRVYPAVAFKEEDPLSHDLVSSDSLRLVSTPTGSLNDVVLYVPLFVLGAVEVPTGAPPFIVTQPVDQGVAKGSEVTFSIKTLSSVPTTYQWYKVLLTESSSSVVAVTGATSSVLMFSNVQSTQKGFYQCEAANLYGSTPSNIVELRVT